MAILWFGRIIWRWNTPWFEGDNITRIEFPLPAAPQQHCLTPIFLELSVGSHTDAKRCAYCHEEFESVCNPQVCVSCGSAAHEECAVLNGGCSVYGCGVRAIS